MGTDARKFVAETNLKMLKDLESLEFSLNDASRWLSQMWANVVVVVVVHSIRRRENRKESDGCGEKSKGGW